MFNFAEISRALVEAGGAMAVEGEGDLLSQVDQLLSQERKRAEIGERGYQFLMRHQGATERVFREIKPLLAQERG
jgi:3-deoxy-D-manno-octulosonic-acid transferase